LLIDSELSVFELLNSLRRTIKITSPAPGTLFPVNAGINGIVFAEVAGYKRRDCGDPSD
jgi:hypothetical protein